MALAVQTAMPQFFLFAEDHDAKDQTTMEPGKRRSQSEKRGQRLYHNMWDRLSLHRFGNWLKKEENGEPPPHAQDADPECPEKNERSHFMGRRGSRKVVPSLPRPITFRRQNSEKRDRLCPNEPENDKRRAFSADRRGGSGLRRTLSPPPLSNPSVSAPDIRSPPGAKTTSDSFDSGDQGFSNGGFPEGHDFRASSIPDFAPREPLPPLSNADHLTDRESVSDGVDDDVLQQELEAKWILNLSMHFRDLSDREKFFITYAEEPNKWRRVTISCDYRDVPPDSLEADLKSLHYQRDKSSRIYESIRDSLPDIQFYSTVTNLKLQTAEGRLHVHVTEDVNEIIPYPSTSSVRHLPGPRFRESAVRFESHISGFVYKVTVDGRVYIKKEIPGPDSVDEFIYEINALCSLQDSSCVIKYEGLVVDDTGEVVKGLLISYAEQGALVDIIFDLKGTTSLSWSRRELWARQIVEGLSEIHEGGFVQGDFTLSNIVIDSDYNAKIIDINRRGCPVGWEPPELSKLIESGLRISIYIGVKSDLFQLGMVLWALAMEQDEPERQERPLTWNSVGAEVPQYFKDMVDICLSEEPRNRLSAKELLSRFPATVDETQTGMPMLSQHSLSSRRSEKEYIDPAAAVELVDIERSRHQSLDSPSRPSFISVEDLGFDEAGASTSYRLSSSGSYIITRGRPRGCGSPHGSTSVSASASRGRRSYNYSRSPTGRVSSISLEESDPDPMFPLEQDTTAREARWAEIYVDRDTKLIHRTSGNIERHDISIDGEALERLTTLSSDKPNDEESPNAAQTPSAAQRQERAVSASTDTLTPTNAAALQIPDKTTSQENRDSLPTQPSPLSRTPPYHGSFHDRVQLRRSYDTTLADLEEEILKTSPESQSSASAVPRENTEVPLAPAFDRLRHYDSGFHEPGVSALQSTSRTTTFGSPPRRDTTSRSVARDVMPPPRVPTFGPPLHADSGFHDRTNMTSNIESTSASDPPEQAEDMSASIIERTKEDEVKVRDAIRKIMAGGFENPETTSKDDSNPEPK